MEKKNQQIDFPFSLIVSAMESGDWGVVDNNLNPNTAEAIEFARAAVTDASFDARDLAYTIWQTTDAEMPDEIKEFALEEISRVAEDEEDSGRFARFRAAFALLKNGDNSELVISTIRGAAEDPDTSEVALDLLEKIK